MQRGESPMDLPGFRFHPTEEELLDFYLQRAVTGKKPDIIGTLNLYRYNPWELPGMAKIGEREWYFYVPRGRKQGNGGRPNRTTEHGFWKATGSDRPIRSVADPKRLIGIKKTLVYYKGRAPRGTKTEWVMNEYRLPEMEAATLPTQRDMVLCKIYRKVASMKELEKRAARQVAEEVEAEAEATGSQGEDSTVEEMAAYSDQYNMQSDLVPEGGGLYKEEVEEIQREVEVSSVLAPPPGLQVQIPKLGLEWMQDPYLTQIRSPWLMDQWSPFFNISNF